MDYFFWFCALAGSGMFLIQFIINIFGMSHDMPSNHEGGSDFTDARILKWLSMQTVTGFFMMFGWISLACQNEFQLHMGPTLGIALGSGFVAALIIRWVFALAHKLKSPGSLFRIEEAIGKEGYVYQSIPREGKGKISTTLQDLTHEIDAISSCKEEIPSFSRVKIIEKIDDNTVGVIHL